MKEELDNEMYEQGFDDCINDECNEELLYTNRDYADGYNDCRLGLPLMF